MLRGEQLTHLEFLRKEKQVAQYRPNVRESSMVSHLDRQKEQERYHAMEHLRENMQQLSNQIAVKLIEERLVETSRKSDLEDQIYNQLEKVLEAEEFELQYQTANLRNLVPRPNIISLFVTAFIVEQLLTFEWIVDIYGTDEEIYQVVNDQVSRYSQIS